MKQQVEKLTATEIEEQKKYAQKYLELVQKELSYGDLLNLDNVTKWTEAYKLHSQMAKNGYIMMPCIGK